MLRIRSAVKEDVGVMLQLVRELAEYEREPDAVVATEEDFLRDGFGAEKRFDCLMAEWDGCVCGFALYFHNYSTWRGRAGLHLEDLFVRPQYRGLGVGKALLMRVAEIGASEGAVRLQWDVLEWNEPAIGFYEKLGAVRLMDWRTMRVDPKKLDLR